MERSAAKMLEIEMEKEVGHCLSGKTTTKILPRNLTWNLKMMVSKRNLLFQGLLFRFHVKFQGCNKEGDNGDLQVFGCSGPEILKKMDGDLRW